MTRNALRQPLRRFVVRDWRRLDANGLVRFAASQQLIDSVGGPSKLPVWRVQEFTVVVTVGSGYQRTTTVFNFSPNGAYQSAASSGSIKIQRRSDAAVIRTLAGGAPKGASVVTFTPTAHGSRAFPKAPSR